MARHLSLTIIHHLKSLLCLQIYSKLHPSFRNSSIDSIQSPIKPHLYHYLPLLLTTRMSDTQPVVPDVTQQPTTTEGGEISKSELKRRQKAERVAAEKAAKAALQPYRDWETDRKSTRLNSSHSAKSRMPSSA